MIRAGRRLWATLLASRGLLLGVLGLAAVAGFGFLGNASSDHSVRARFTNATGLVAGNEVRIAGVPAGGVDRVTPGVDAGTGQQYAEVVLHVGADHWPLRQGAHLAVRPKGVLSNVYVDVAPGSGPAMDGGHTFAVTETSSPVQLDDFTNIFDRSVTTSIRTQLQEGVLIFGQNGASDLNAVIQEVNPLSSHLQPVTAVLAERSPELDRLNFEFDTITSDFAREDTAVRGLFIHGNTALAALVAKETQLQGTLDHAAGTLQSLDQGLQGETANLQAIFTKGPAALAQAKATADTLTPLLVNINPHIPSLDILLNEFITATGYPGAADSLRIDGTTPPLGYNATGCGGTPENPCAGGRP